MENEIEIVNGASEPGQVPPSLVGTSYEPEAAPPPDPELETENNEPDPPARSGRRGVFHKER